MQEFIDVVNKIKIMNSEITIIGNQINSYWTIAISLIFSFILLNIYRNSQNKENEKGIQGIKYLSFALLIWTVSGILTILYYVFFVNTESIYPKMIYFSIRTIFSIANSAFILLAIPSIELENELRTEILRKDKKSVSVASTIVLLGTLAIALMILDTEDFTGNNRNIHALLKQPIYFVGVLDLLFAVLVIWELIIRKVQAFKERNLEFMIPITWVLIGCIFISQILNVLPAFILGLEKEMSYLILQPFFLLTYKTLLIFLFIFLLYSWQVKKGRNDIENLKNEFKKQILLKNVQINEQKEKISHFESLEKKNEKKLNITNEQFDKLSDKQKIIFQKLKEELTYKEIGTELNTSKHTVITHIRTIERILGIKGKGDLEKTSKKFFNY